MNKIKEEILSIYPNANIVKHGSCYNFKPDYESEFVYYIDYKRKTIVAVLNRDFYDDIAACTCDTTVDLLNLYKTYNNIKCTILCRYKTFKGKAKCHPVDDFDIKVGLKMARDRALNKYYNYVYKLNKCTMNYLEKCISEQSKILNHYKSKINKM